jgi:hypothetical protein
VIDLKLAEVKLFRTLTGRSWQRAMEGFMPKPCGPHRLMFGACKPCRLASEPYCPEHTEAYTACEACEGGDFDETTVAALAFIWRRRSEPDLSWDEYQENVPYVEMVQDLGEMGKASTGSGISSRSTSNGSQPSSGSARRSASPASRS